MQNLTPNVKTIRINNAAAAGTTDITCTSVDMSGFNSARFIALLGTLTATQVTKLVIAQSDDDGSTDTYSTIHTGTAAADADSNKMLITEVNFPGKRYLRCVVDRGTANAVVDGVIVELFNASIVPVVADASVSVQALLNNPSE